MLSAKGIDDLVSVAVAEVHPDGGLVSGNAGFRRLTAGCGRDGNVRRCFISPSLPELAGLAPAADGISYRGLVTLGDPSGRTWTLVGTVRRRQGRLLIVAEHDIEELEKMDDAVLELNRELVTTSRELQAVNRRLVESEARVRELSLTDPLTGLANRRHVEELWVRERARAGRSGGALSVLLGDIDHFKSVNDRFGHDAGDEVLKAFSQVMKSLARASDLVARIGGEEFVVLLTGGGEAHAVALAGRIRSALAASSMPPLPAPVTASFGTAELRTGDDWASLLKRADEALYEAKRAGRDRVCASAPSPGTPPQGAGRV